MNDTFPTKLNTLRKARNLTVHELAKRAGVGQSLISGLQTGNRVIGEHAARKIARALQLQGEERENFVYLAINDCSEKVLQSSRAYPAEVLNLLACKLRELGILSDKITRCVRKKQADDADAAIYLNDGKAALINVEVAYR
jgi:transcriptional regulator with XRE-family HTH domain